jgi:hypothetical protein
MRLAQAYRNISGYSYAEISTDGSFAVAYKFKFFYNQHCPGMVELDLSAVVRAQQL